MKLHEDKTLFIQLLNFAANTLNIRPEFIEKDLQKALASKIRHFYDLYYLANDTECAKYIHSADFQKDLSELFAHDQREFNKPTGWQTKTVKNSPLLTEFTTLWASLSSTYQTELTPLVFSEIPDKKLVAEKFIEFMEKL
jgi:hypothetical protein